MLAANADTVESDPSTLTDIYRDDVAIAVWRRQLNKHVDEYARTLTAKTPIFETRFVKQSSQIASQLKTELPLSKYRDEFVEDVALVVDMFSCLFELDNVGLRMAVLRTAMCPKFHVDQVPCRLISTYAGAATEWHPNEQVERREERGVEPLAGATPNQLCFGDVALLKGEAWEGNEGRGLVHRSPYASEAQRRLVLTLDFA